MSTDPRRIYRFEVPVDDQWHEYVLGGDPLHVAAVRFDLVEFWAYSAPLDAGVVARQLRVFGTGQVLPDACRHWGTCIAPAGSLRLVWHLIEDPKRYECPGCPSCEPAVWEGVQR